MRIDLTHNSPVLHPDQHLGECVLSLLMTRQALDEAATELDITYTAPPVAAPAWTMGGDPIFAVEARVKCFLRVAQGQAPWLGYFGLSQNSGSAAAQSYTRRSLQVQVLRKGMRWAVTLRMDHPDHSGYDHLYLSLPVDYAPPPAPVPSTEPAQDLWSLLRQRRGKPCT